MLTAAFELQIGKVSQPIRTDDGFYLVWVSGIEPAPERAVLHRRLLGELSQTYGQEFVAAARIEMAVQ